MKKISLKVVAFSLMVLSVVGCQTQQQKEEVNAQILSKIPLVTSELQKVFVGKTLSGVVTTGRHAYKPVPFVYDKDGETLTIKTPRKSLQRSYSISNNTLCKGGEDCLEVRQFEGKLYGSKIGSNTFEKIWTI